MNIVGAAEEAHDYELDPVAIGTKLWQYDFNHRVYARGADGRADGGPTFEGHFVEHVVKDETPRSWVVEHWGHEVKVSKTTFSSAGRNGQHGSQWYTARTKALAIWRNTNLQPLLKYIERLDIETMQRVAEDVGYKAK